jgi:hypothetical protein
MFYELLCGFCESIFLSNGSGLRTTGGYGRLLKSLKTVGGSFQMEAPKMCFGLKWPNIQNFVI